MERKIVAMLLDTRSIQKYIFSGNKLMTNVGASYIVADVFKNVMFGVLGKHDLKMPAESWESTENIVMETDLSIDCEIAYVGGGNMLILLDKKDCDNIALAKKLIGEWSRELLVKAPGLRTGAAVGYVEFGDNFQESIDELYRQLKNNQNTIFPNVDLPYSGLTVECNISGKNADVFDEDSKKYVSAEAIAKKNAFEAADAALKAGNDIKDIVKEYSFTSEIGGLGQKEGDSYIAVVHIDGNDMGKKFANCASLQQRKKLSLAVAKATREAFADLLCDLTKEYSSYLNDTFVEGGLLSLKKKVLPIRPIILGGDDITFVCAGKLGIIYAKRFMEHLKRKMLDVYKDKGAVESVKVPLFSCAGVAIVPSKYPFFRSYELAEELCGEAKKKARATSGSSWLDYLVVHGEQSSDLAKIRESEYKGYLGNMHYGPYLIDDISQPKSIERLILGALELGEMPRNKVKKMRDVLAKDTGVIRLFVEQLKHTDTAKFMPVVENKMDQFRETLWSVEKGVNVTPYVDMIEVIDFIYDERKLMK